MTKKELLELVLDVADRAGVKVAIGGGVAVNTYGYRRDTADVDAFFHESDRAKVLRALQKSIIPDLILDELDQSHWIVVPEGNPADERIDLLFAVGDPEESAIEMAETRKYQGKEIPVFPIDLLVATKYLAAREDPKDALDIFTLWKKGAYDVGEIQERLRQMGFDEDAKDFPKLIEYLQKIPRKPGGRGSK
ncbi:MAG: nucleotidyltransferase [Candidatus Sulfotelmatobacter sp.]